MNSEIDKEGNYCKSASMTWKCEIAHGKQDCMFDSPAMDISKRVREMLDGGDIHTELDRLRKEAKEHGGINKVQVLTSDTSKRVLIIVQRYSESDIEYQSNYSDQTEEELRRANRQFVLFADEFMTYIEHTHTWLRELSLLDMTRIVELTQNENSNFDLK